MTTAHNQNICDKFFLQLFDFSDQHCNIFLNVFSPHNLTSSVTTASDQATCTRGIGSVPNFLLENTFQRWLPCTRMCMWCTVFMWALQTITVVCHARFRLPLVMRFIVHDSPMQIPHTSFMPIPHTQLAGRLHHKAFEVVILPHTSLSCLLLPTAVPNQAI